jgi:hypothetical protein
MGTVLSMPKRPVCINHGCNTPVLPSAGKISDPNPRWRVHCGPCIKANYGAQEHRAGVTPFKSGRCSNQDEHLGFKCVVDYKKTPWAQGMTEVDHKNGDHTDNRIKNLDELCPMCHKHKGQLSGDYAQLRSGDRKSTKRKQA